MSQTFSSTLHLSSGSVAATAVPITLVIWVNTSGGQARKMLSLVGSGALTNIFGVALDVTAGATNKVSAYRSSASGNDQALSTTAITTGAWQHMGAVFASATSAAAYLNGVNKGTSAGNFTPTGINQTLISGRASDFSFGIAGQAAHAAVWARTLSDVEMAYLGGGGNPQAIKGCVSYWKIASPGGTPESPVIDQVGTNNLIASGALAVGTSDPNFQSFMTGGPVGAQSYTQGSAISSLNLAAGGPYFDDVSSAFTVALQQATATATTSTTTSSAGTTLREIPMASVSGFSAGDYVKIGANAITRLLAVNASSVSLLVATDQTYSASATVTRYAVNPLTVTGLSMSSNVYSGSPTAASTQNLCFFRATCTGSAALIADTDVFTITVTGSGGGGGGGLQMPAGMFSGGFVGG